MNPVFNRRQILRNRARFEHAFAKHRQLFDEADEGLLERLSWVKRDFRRILLVDGPDGALRGALLQADPAREIFSSDFDENEILSSPEKDFDLVLSNLALHGVNDVPGALVQIRRALKPDGLFLATLLGGETLHELRECLYEAENEIRSGLSPRVAPFMDIRDAGALLQRAGFALPVVEREKLTFIYRDVFALMRELRGMGEGNAILAREKRFTPKSLFARAGEIYRARHGFEDGIKATFEVISLSGWAAHDSQQQPLQPGQAKNSLAEALETREVALSDPARPRNASTI